MTGHKTQLNNLFYHDPLEELEGPLFTRAELTALIQAQPSFRDRTRGAIATHLSQAFCGDKRLNPNYRSAIELAVRTKLATKPIVAQVIIDKLTAITERAPDPRLIITPTIRQGTAEYATLIRLGFLPAQIVKLRENERPFQTLMRYTSLTQQGRETQEVRNQALQVLGEATAANRAILNRISLEPGRGRFLRAIATLRASL